MIALSFNLIYISFSLIFVYYYNLYIIYMHLYIIIFYIIYMHLVCLKKSEKCIFKVRQFIYSIAILFLLYNWFFNAFSLFLKKKRWFII